MKCLSPLQRATPVYRLAVNQFQRGELLTKTRHIPPADSAFFSIQLRHFFFLSIKKKRPNLLEWLSVTLEVFVRSHNTFMISPSLSPLAQLQYSADKEHC